MRKKAIYNVFFLYALTGSTFFLLIAYMYYVNLLIFLSILKMFQDGLNLVKHPLPLGFNHSTSLMNINTLLDSF